MIYTWIHQITSFQVDQVITQTWWCMRPSSWVLVFTHNVWAHVGCIEYCVSRPNKENQVEYFYFLWLAFWYCDHWYLAISHSGQLRANVTMHPYWYQRPFCPGNISRAIQMGGKLGHPTHMVYHNKMEQWSHRVYSSDRKFYILNTRIL